MNRRKTIVALVTCLCLAIGYSLYVCAKYIVCVVEYEMIFLGDSGGMLATGVMTIHKSLPTQGEVTGRYRMSIRPLEYESDATKCFVRLFDDKKNGRIAWKCAKGPEFIDDSRYAIDFMPGVQDANIIVFANPSNTGEIKGIWYCATLEGGLRGGAFVAEKR